MAHDPCAVCQRQNQLSGPSEREGDVRFQCERCGNYDVTPTYYREGRKDREVRIAGYIRSQNDAGITPRLTAETVRRVEQMPIPACRKG
jgi:hypothetical protein